MKKDFDLAIIGSGFSASVLAMVARRTGHSAILIERGSHPRFAIGESTSPLMNLIIEELARRYDLPRLLPLVEYGSWQQYYPDVVCGKKRGFTYFKHERGQSYRVAPDRSNQLLVAASPSDEVADTHWLRSDVDHFLLKEATALGADYLDQTSLTDVHWDRDGGAILSGLREGRTVRLRARMVIDAGGTRGFLAKRLNLNGGDFDGYPPTQSLYSHFIDVRRCDGMPEYEVAGAPPYAMDDAALHHVFDQGWMWVLRFNNGVTSAGIAVTDEMARELNLAEGEPAWRRFLMRFPTIAAQFAESKAIREFTWMPRLAWRAQAASGRGWALLPSAAAFIDPLFSTGMPLALLGIERLGRIFEKGLDDAQLSGMLAEYGATTIEEADHTARFIAGCYGAFSRFERFIDYSMFYFAAASYSEMARRLGRRHLVKRFLAADREPFASELLAISQLLGKSRNGPEIDLSKRVRGAIEPLNVAGLCNENKRNWYGIDLDDLIEGAAKLEMTPLEVRALISVRDLDQRAIDEGVSQAGIEMTSK